MAPISIIDEKHTTLSLKNSIYHNDNIKDEFFKGKHRTTPNTARRIVPKSLDSLPNAAWDSKDSSSILINKLDDISNETSKNDKSNLYKSPSELNLFDESLPYLPQSRRASCKFIALPNEEAEDEKDKYYSAYDHLISPRSNTTSNLNESSTSSKFLKNTNKPKFKTEKPLFKFLCPPYFILLVGLIEICVYLFGDDTIKQLLMYSPYHRHEVWRFISYMLLHSGVTHLTLNIIIQTLLATPLELEQGWWRCAGVYIGGGIAGALGASVMQPSLYMVGASAGVYALLVSHVANVLVQHSEVKYKYYRLFSVAVLAGSDIAFSIAHYHFASENVSPIGWAAHCAGAVAGISIGLLIYKGCDKQNIYIKAATWSSLLLLLTGVGISILLNIFYVKS